MSPPMKRLQIVVHMSSTSSDPPMKRRATESESGDADSFSACGEERWDRLGLRVSSPRRGPAGGPAGDLDVF